MKKLFVFLTIACGAHGAHASLPTVGYVNEYLRQICQNPNLTLLGGNMGNLISLKYALTAADTLNIGTTDWVTGNTVKVPSYVSKFGKDSVMGTDFLPNLRSMINNTGNCCLDGETSTGECRACGTWTRDGDTCPAGFVYIELRNTVMVDGGQSCPAGTMPYFEISDECDEYIH